MDLVVGMRQTKPACYGRIMRYGKRNGLNVGYQRPEVTQFEGFEWNETQKNSRGGVLSQRPSIAFNISDYVSRTNSKRNPVTEFQMNGSRSSLKC